MATVDFDMSEIREFFHTVEKAAKGDFRRDMELFLEGVGNEFLRVVQDEIVRRKVMDSRLLLASFERGADGNVWELTEGGLTLEVGTNVEYASYVNDGHWTIDPGKTKHFTLPNGTLARFVPGRWEGEKFIYEPEAKTGMVLKQQWIDGQPYFDSALRIIDKLFPDLLEEKLQQWLDKYF